MKKLVLAISVLAISTVSALGADLPVRAYTKASAMGPEPVYDWTGFYIGVNGGGGWGRTEWLLSNAAANSNHDISGGLAGGQIGYNWQVGAWVFGLEADGDWANIRGSASCPNAAFNCSSNVRDLASFRGRVGWASGPILFYGTGGLGYSDTRYSTLTVAGGAPALGSTGFFSSSQWGYAAGAGVEWGFAQSWSAKAEYVHYGFDTVTAPAATLGVVPTTALRENVDAVKVGVNYRWGGPLVAKY